MLVQTSFQLVSIYIYFDNILVFPPKCAHASGGEASSR